MVISVYGKLYEIQDTKYTCKVIHILPDIHLRIIITTDITININNLPYHQHSLYKQISIIIVLSTWCTLEYITCCEYF